MSNKDNFIMLPTNDFCFKELMQNPKVRKGFIAGILRKDPKEITDTILLPTETRRDYVDDKLPQVLVRIEQGEKVSGESIIQRMEFFSGTTQEEFEAMAKQNEYMEEAVNTLFELSADEKKRLEYEAREKAIRDYNTQMYSAEQRGMQRGIEITRRILKLKTEGKSSEQIAEKCDLPLEQIKEIMEW